MITIYNTAIILFSLASLIVFLIVVKKDAKKGMEELKKHNDIKRRVLSSRQQGKLFSFTQEDKAHTTS
jgi:hypothetical protein